MSVCTFPLQLVRPTRPGSARGRRFTPVRYAYCLLDLDAQNARHPTRVFHQDAYFHHLRISGQVEWQLTCRTNGHGYLVPVDGVQWAPENNPYLQNDAAAHRRIDGEQPLLLRPGMRFNLYWSYALRYYLQVRDVEQSPLIQEYLLHRCSTCFDRGQRSIVRSYLATLPVSRDLHSGHGGNEAWRQFMDDRFFRDPASGPSRYRRALARLSTQGFFLQPEDDDLRRAMQIADRIEEALRAPQERSVMAYINDLDNIINILDRYERRRSRGVQSLRDVGEQHINSILDDALRVERYGSPSFSGIRGDLIRSLESINRYIRMCGEHLAPLLQNALLQAYSHYERDVAQNYVQRLMKAMGVALARDFHRDFLREQSHFSNRTQAMQGGVSTDALGTFLGCFKQLNDAGVFSAADFVDKTTEWMEALIPHLIRERPERTASILNRLNQFLRNIEHPDVASGQAPAVVDIHGEDFRLSTVDADGRPIHFSVRGRLRVAHRVLERIGTLVSLCNTYFAFQDLSEDRSFKNYLSAFSSTVEAATAINGIKGTMAEVFGLTDAMVNRIGGVTTIIVAGIDALDHVSEGNQVAALGNTVQAMGGVLSLLIGTSGGAGVFVALVVVAGAAIQHWSLSDDERIVSNFREHEEARCRRLDEYDFLDLWSSDQNTWDLYLRERQMSY